MQEFRKRCAEAGLAFTHQRQLIYRALAESEVHPTTEAVYERVRAEIPSISLATVYKNIKTFLSVGLLREVTLLHDSQRLDANLENHHHFICMQCKMILDLDDRDLSPVRLKRKLPPGSRVQRYEVEVLGLCARCARSN
jgi:Fur family peroxide stress response transcriptional regulator